MKRALIALLLACGSEKQTALRRAPTPAITTDKAEPTDKAELTLKQYLAEARKQSDSYLSGDVLPVGAQVRALTDNSTRAWWTTLTPLENFFLFEISPVTAARAPATTRAEAFCAGLRDVFAEWWSEPGSNTSETTQHILASKTPVMKCLVPLFEDQRPIYYAEGETSLMAENLHWIRADLAAGVVALLLGEDYDYAEKADVRAVQRDDLRKKALKLTTVE